MDSVYRAPIHLVVHHLGYRGSSWMQRTMMIKRSTFNILIVCMLILIFFFRFMKSFCIEAAVYRWLHKEHLQFACEMKKMEHKQRYEKEFVSAVSAFHIFSAFVMHITILLAKSCIAWSTIRWFKWVTHEGPRIHQWEAWGPNTTNTHK